MLEQIIKCTQNANLEIRISSFRSVGEIAKHFYDYINEDIIDFVDLTKIHVKYFFYENQYLMF